MLFSLNHIEGGDQFYLLENKEYVVGRKNTDIIISNDQSISRKHAIIKVRIDSVKLVDCASKYGTFHNTSKIAANTEVTVEDKDIIKFGVYKSLYRLEVVKIVTTGSGLTNEQKSELKQKLAPIGGSLVPSWNDICLNVTAQEIMLTIKVLHALIDNKPIVTLKYWDQFISHIKENKLPPNPVDFKPPITETLINKIDLSLNPERKSIFKNKIFVFPNEKIKNKMSELVSKTGGLSISWEKQPLTLSQVSTSKSGYLFIHSDDVQDISSSFKEICQHLTKMGERTIPIQEIAMAIVLCSCEKDCNPKFNRIHSVFVKQPLNSCSEIFPLAVETPTEEVTFTDQSMKKELIIPESLDEDLSVVGSVQSCEQSHAFSAQSVKRTERAAENNLAKRIRLDNSQASISHSSDSQTKKRKADKDVAPVSKKSTLKENPFAIKKNKTLIQKTQSDNPFTAIQLKTEINIDDDNPFRGIMQKPVKERLSVSGKSIDSVNLASNNSVGSRIPEHYVSDILNMTWMKVTNSMGPKEIDPEFKQVFEDFKNVTIIETLPNTSIISFPPRIIFETLNESSGNKNFKKFRKSRPRHLQTTIIQLVSQNISKENVGMVISSGNEDEEEEEIRRPVIKNTKNRFKF